MFSNTSDNDRAHERQRFLVALGFALGLHLVLLLISPFSSILGQPARTIQPDIIIQLSQQKELEPIESITPLPTIDPAPNIEVESVVETEPIVQETAKKKEAAKPITAAVLQNWSLRETDQLLNTNPKVLSEFGATFVAPKVASEAAQTSFTSGYGDTHVVTKVGNKRVCYLQGQQDPQDEWSKGLVMFYNCAQKDKFTLEIP